MRLMVKFADLQGIIIGYCPDKKGMPQAIVLAEALLHAVPLSQIQVLNGPKKFMRPQHKPNGHVTTSELAF